MTGASTLSAAVRPRQKIYVERGQLLGVDRPCADQSG
jgi:hypothetical protein